MKQNFTIWFWHQIASPHMTALASCLAQRGHDVVYVATQPVSEDRIALGWKDADPSPARIYYASTPAAIAQLVDQAPKTAVHLCEGVRGNGLIGFAQAQLEIRRVGYWVLMETIDDRGWRGFLKRAAYSTIFWNRRRSINGVLAIGHQTSSWVIKRGFPAREVFPFTYFLPSCTNAVSAATATDRPFRFIYIGQLIERKRVFDLLHALEIIDRHDFELSIVGTGNDAAEIKAHGEQTLGGRLKWIGSVDMTEIPSLLGDADCLVLPSVHDGWGVVVSEAMLAGIPAICSDKCGAASAVLACGLGQIFVAGDVMSLARALQGQLDQGKPTATQRVSLARWAQSLTADQGAIYLEAILDWKGGNCMRPAPPWTAIASVELSGD